MTFKAAAWALSMAMTWACAWQPAMAADEGTKQAAAELLATTNMGPMLSKVMEQMVDDQLKKSPELLPYRQVMLNFFGKYMSLDNLKPALIDLYAEAFTASELQDIIHFYKTPSGKKSLQKLPDLMNKGGQIGVQMVQEHLPELRQMMADEAQRIQKLQAR